MMPSGAELVADAPQREWRASEGALTYRAASIVAPQGALTDSVLLRLVVSHVGYKCQRGLKVHGRLDNPAGTAVQFDTACTDGKELHGMVRLWNNRAISIATQGPKGVAAVVEPFLYSFEILH